MFGASNKHDSWIGEGGFRVTELDRVEFHAAGNANFFRGPNMSWLNNFRIAFKVSLIVVLMAIVTVGTAVFATHKMRTADDANASVSRPFSVA